MCGITGILAYEESAAPVDGEELLRARDAMVTRGPDGAGTWLSPDRRVGLANRRLAIMDLSSRGAQPMASPDGRFVITFNGEIYNHRELRVELERKGFLFSSTSDTEVLLHLYADRGSDMVHALRGMYAFAIWDQPQGTLFLSRDPFGIKPLYYADCGGTLRFASQVKALLAGGALSRAPESAGAVGFLLWGYVPEPFTLYREIRAVPAGASLTARLGSGPRLEAHFSVRDELLAAQAKARPFRQQDREALAAALRDSVAHHLVSDVPVGVFLSAGIDSTLLTALAAEHERVSLRTVTLGFEEHRGTELDEVPIAEQTAASRMTRHETRWIRSEDFEGEMQAILDAMDQPTTDGVNTYFVCREASRAGLKVALSGLGGDELFGGYPSFRDVPRLARWLRPARAVPAVGRLVRRTLAPVLSMFTSPKYAGLLEYGGSATRAYLLRRALHMPWEVGPILDSVAVRTGFERLDTVMQLGESTRDVREPYAQVAALELSWYMRNQLLRDADWAGMAHSVEVRVPFVDVALFRAIAPWLVSGRPPRKADAAAAPRATLPPGILARPKSGFSVPLRDWLAKRQGNEVPSARGLRGWARHVLPPQPRQFRVLALVTDAFGGHGGIAKFNRDLLSALAAMPECAEVVALPRIVPEPPDSVPARVRFRSEAAGNKARFIRAVLREAVSGPYDLVIAGHINLCPLAMAVSWWKRTRSLLVIHGIDAWTAHRSRLVRTAARHMDRVAGVSKVTLDRFQQWSNVAPERLRLLPNCVDARRFAPGPKSEALVEGLGLAGCTVIMTLGRLASEERYKGFDEVIEALPALAAEIPEVAYLICGEGPDRARLEAKAAELGVADRVRFTGFVEERHKVHFYRLADAYVMPSRGEGFGIVLLEALACGLPVLGSSADGSREALMDGRLGEIVEPSRPCEVKAGIVRALRRGKAVPREMAHFSQEAYFRRASTIIRETLGHEGGDKQRALGRRF